MPDKHLSSQFDSELNAVSTRVMELGGLVESQIRQAVYALSQFSAEVADEETGEADERSAGVVAYANEALAAAHAP